MRLELEKPDGSKEGPFEVVWPGPVVLPDVGDFRDVVARLDRSKGKEGVSIEGRDSGAAPDSERERIVLLGDFKPDFGLLDINSVGGNGRRKYFTFRLVD